VLDNLDAFALQIKFYANSCLNDCISVTRLAYRARKRAADPKAVDDSVALWKRWGLR